MNMNNNFNHDFNNNERNDNTDNRATNIGNRDADNTPVGNGGDQPRTQNGNDRDANTGSYAYTGDRLTESKTSFTTPESQSPNGNGTGFYNQNGFRPQQGNPYQMPRMNGNGGIYYSPVEENGGKKKKEKKAKTVSVTKGGIAVFCVAAICLSCATGFLGAYAANALNGKTEVPMTQTGTNGTVVAENRDNTAVIYRSVNTTIPGSAAEGGLTYKDVAALVQDSVVEIVTEFTQTSLWFQYVASGAGSGVIVSEDGYVITNNHVISDEDTGEVSDSVTVRLRNGEEYKAEVIGADSDSDIAVLKIEAEGLTPAVCGDSSKLAVGEEVMAVGNPLGELGGTVTNGIVSATDREIVVGDVTMNLIQTNAAVNPGNSGGGLFNMNGELVGIVNAKSSGSDVEGLGFAIPVNDALSVSEQLLEYGYVRGKVMIGVTFLDATDASVARYYGLKAGLYVSELTEGYNDKVLKPGDRVIAINGNEVSAYEDLTSVVKSSAVGDVLTFQLYRDGKLTEAEVTVFEKIPAKEEANVEFETEKSDDRVIYPDEDMDVYGSPMPDGGDSYNPFEGTPFEDWFSGSWGGY